MLLPNIIMNITGGQKKCSSSFFFLLFRISKGMTEEVNENLSTLLSAACKEPSVKGILFQARYGFK
jgi:hypothetical protein